MLLLLLFFFDKNTDQNNYFTDRVILTPKYWPKVLLYWSFVTDGENTDQNLFFNTDQINGNRSFVVNKLIIKASVGKIHQKRRCKIQKRTICKKSIA